MTDIAAIRSGIAANLKPLADNGITVYDGWQGHPQPPCVIVEVGPVSFDKAANRGLDEWTFSVVALVSLVHEQVARDNLDRMIQPSGELSIKALVESDRSLGGAADDALVLSATEPRPYITNATGEESYGVEFSVRVYAKGD